MKHEENTHSASIWRLPPPRSALFKTTGELLESGKFPPTPPTPVSTFWKIWPLPCRAKCRKRALPLSR
ncbi:MAG: hypothetical protein ACLVJH_17865 [Faecalibacterium prausnitzii]